MIYNDTTARPASGVTGSGELQTSEPYIVCPQCGKRDWQSTIAAGQCLGCLRKAARPPATDAAFQRREAADDERAWALASAGLTDLVGDYLDLLTREGIADPLAERLTVATVLADLLSLAGVDVPRQIEARLQEPGDLLNVAAD
jgi:hypothetical protein